MSSPLKLAASILLISVLAQSAKAQPAATSAKAPAAATSSAKAPPATASTKAPGSTASAGKAPGDANAPKVPKTMSPDDQLVDIQANDQEFAGEKVIAHGNVRVTYKTTLIVGPSAELFRDASGQAQKAIFTGHPHLIQGRSKMDADTLIFEIATGGVIADGHSHSEVASSGDEDNSADEEKAQKELLEKQARNLKNDKDKDKDDEEDTPATIAKEKAAAATAAMTPPKKKPPKPPTHAMAPEMIITDSDHQEYIKESGKFIANGSVHVKTGDINVHADRLNLVYGTDNKPESAVFNGNVDATQFENNTKSDAMVYFLATQRLQATGNVKSTVIQHKTADDPKKGGPSGILTTNDDAAIDPIAIGDIPDDEILLLNSDAQDYSKDTGRITAQGNVHLKYGEITGYGPTVIVLRNDEGQADKVLFRGRSQINQPGKRWIGDQIQFTISDKKVLAAGNTRAIILSPPGKKGSDKKSAPATPEKDAKLAAKPVQSGDPSMDGQAQAIADTRRNTVSEKTPDTGKSSAPENKEVPQ